MTSSGLSANDTLNDWLAWQETAHAKSWDFGLDRIGEVWRRLGAPRLAQKIITIAGTNGKGSCVRWLEGLSKAHGISVASFSSPHLLDYRERIRFDGHWVTEQALVDAFVAIDMAREEISLSYFEWSALAAFYLMARTENLSLALLEVGLGGRLDATNIIDADAVIMTTIGLDHMQWLGQTIEEIAAEKAAVMRKGQFVVFADNKPPQALIDYADKLAITPEILGQSIEVYKDDRGLNLSFYGQGSSFLNCQYENFPLPQKMFGEHQLKQFAACARVFAHFFALDKQAMAHTLIKTYNPARLMRINYNARPWLLDVAHNADSAAVLANYLQQILPGQKKSGQKVPMICGMLKDKDAKSVFVTLKDHVSCWYLLSLDGARGGDENWLCKQAMAAGIAKEKLQLCGDIEQAVTRLTKDYASAELGVVMGSFVTVSAALALMNISLDEIK